MAVSAFQDYPLADRDREWDGAAAEKRVRRWAKAEDEPNEKYRDAHVWYDSDNKDNFTGVQAAHRRRDRRQDQGRAARGDGRRQHHAGRARRRRPAAKDIDRVKSHLAKYYAKMGEEAPWERD